MGATGQEESVITDYGLSYQQHAFTQRAGIACTCGGCDHLADLIGVEVHMHEEHLSAPPRGVG